MIGLDSFTDCLNQQHSNSIARKRVSRTISENREEIYSPSEEALNQASALSQWKRIMLLVIAITVHNIPEGLAVGVSFGAIGNTESATFESARNLAIGIGIQNFPEGLAVSLPLHAAGFSMYRAFWYGQLSGMVEPIFGVLGAVAVTVASIILPYALSFAAGAMIYIVADDILPEAHTRFVIVFVYHKIIHKIIILFTIFQWKWIACDVGHHHWFHYNDVLRRWTWIRQQNKFLDA